MNNKNDVKAHNISAVLQCIHHNGTISKGNIASRLGITPVTSHKLVTDLYNAGLVKNSGEYVSYGGKKAALYTPDPDFGLIIGVIIKRSSCAIVLTDACLGIKEYHESQISPTDKGALLDFVCGRVSEMIDGYKDHSNITGMGVSIPGRADGEGQVIDMPGFPEWSRLPLRDILQGELGIPVYVNNDANALALSVKWQLPGQDEDFVCIQIEDGIGLGIVSEGELFTGAGHRGSEFGHITIDPNGEPCPCGKRGCLQTYVDDKKVIAEYNSAHGTRLSRKEAMELLARGEKTMMQAYEEYMKHLRLTVDNVITAFSPAGVYLSNEAAFAIEGFEAELNTPLFKTDRQKTPVTLLTHKEIRQSAACALIYEEIMKRPLDFVKTKNQYTEEQQC